MKVAPKGTNNHQAIQQLMLMAHEGLASGCSLAEEGFCCRKPTKVEEKVVARALEDICHFVLLLFLLLCIRLMMLFL